MSDNKSIAEVDYSQFKKGTQFLLICAITMRNHYINIVEVIPTDKLPDLEIVISDMIDNTGGDFDDLNVAFRTTDGPDEPGIYEILCELNKDGDSDEDLDFDALQWRQHQIYTNLIVGNLKVESQQTETEETEEVFENLAIKW